MKAYPYFLASMALVIAFLIWRLSVVNRKLDSSAAVLQEKEAELTHFKAQSGKIVTEKPAAEITKADLKEHYADLAADLQDMKIKLSQVKAVLKAVVEAKGEGVVSIVHDTIRVPGSVPMFLDSVFIDDHYLALRGGIHQGNFGYHYTYQDSIVMAISRKRKGWFGKETLIGSARLSNPNARAVSSTSILIKGARDKRFVISVGASYNPFTNTFSPAIQAGYALIKF